MTKYAKSYFELQLLFAERVAGLLKWDLSDVLADYTTMRNVISLNGGNEDSTAWSAFCEELRNARNKLDFIYSAYVDGCKRDTLVEKQHPEFGCFSFLYPWENTRLLRLHFGAHRPLTGGVLASRNRGKRHAELTSLFQYVKDRLPNAEGVRGNSWLHNIEAYRRLFPPEYYQNGIQCSVEEELPYEALWGQFVSTGWEVEKDIKAEFLERLERCRSVQECLECFPHRPMTVRCSIDHFYRFYGIA